MSRLTTIFLLTSLIFVSGLVRAGEFQVSSSGSKVVYKTASDDFKAPSGRSWSQIINFGDYESTQSLSGKVRHTPSGAVSAQSISGGVKLSVARQTVLKNLLTKAVAGGRIAAGIGSGPVGWALTAATAYELVAPTLAGHGYVYDKQYGNFVAEDVHVYCVAVSGLCTDQIRQETVLNSSAVYADLKNPTPEMLKEKLCKKLGAQHFGGGSSRIAVDWAYIEEDQICSVQFEYTRQDGYARPGDRVWMSTRNFEKVPKVKKPITQSEFDAIIGPAADASPTRYVNATADEKGVVPGVTVSPNVTVPNGTVVTIGPYTDSNGQPQQVTVTFRTANGETTVSVQVTPRPDLSPNSPSAPSASPNTSGQSSPSGSPNSSGQTNSQTSPQIGGQTGGQTGSEASPQTGGQTSGQTGSEASPKTDGEPDKKDEDKPKDGSFLCNLFPDILACDKMGKPEEGMFDDIKIPHVTDETTWNTDNFLPPNGVCPQPKSFNIWGRPVQISYEPLCVFMQNIRFAVLLGFIIMSAFIVFGSLRKG